MADLDDGYTRIANELLEAVMAADLTARQLKVVLAVIRKTYGFGKKFDRITNTQISDMTGIHHTHVCKAKNEMIGMGVIITNGIMIGVNKVVSDWNFNISQHSETLAEIANKRLAKSANTNKPIQLNTKETIQNTKRKDPSKPPKGGREGGSLRDELITLLEGKFDFNKAAALHDAVEAMIIDAGYECIREFRVADRGDGRPGRIDLLASNGEGDVCGIEIDRITPRDKSAVKLKQVASGFILVREGVVSDHYELDGIPVISAHPLSSSSDGVSRDEIIKNSREALEFYNAMAGAKCQDYKPFMTLLAPTQSRDGYSLSDLKAVIKWVVMTWKRRNDSVAKPNNICRVTRFDGYLSDALVWADGQGSNPVPCPHKEIIALWNEKFPGKSVVMHEWSSRRPAYRNLAAVWNGKTNQGNWREVKHLGQAFDLIGKSTLFSGAENKPWLTLDWILKPENWGSVYEQAINEHRQRKGIIA
ncbi:replication protein [Shimwellia blattae]|uniref:replication protein n=1 Tax=Shimwellia blattae TaxID=563 RepID=UPI001E29111F|nr:replication protein [Shimwellia blattae]